MSIKKHLWLLGPATYLISALFFVSYADAAGGGKDGGAANGYQQAKFKVSLKGVQTVEHAYKHVATGPCDINITSGGGETLRFKSTKAVKMTATKLPGLPDPVFMSKQAMVRIPVKATITRSHNTSAGSPAPGCPDNGGGAEPGPGPDCGTKVIKPWWLGFDYWKRDRIELMPEDVAGGDPFERCGGWGFPYLLQGETFGKRPSADLPVNELFDEKIGKLITIGTGSHGTVDPEGWENRDIRWELTLKRIG
jgi:hypothetical protein